MDNDLINSQGNGPINRSSASERIAVFNANANSIYNKFTPYTNSGIGPSQPFVYTKLNESTFNKNLTRYDSYAFPIGSTARDLKRVGQFLVTGNGLLYVGKQLVLQNQNAFNETRIYNPLSALKAVAKPASLGLIDYPQRHLETSGGILNFFKDALLSTIGFQTKDSEKPRIDGTAVGGDNGVAYSNYAGARGGARAGLLRLNTAKAASAIFESTWVTNPSQNGTSGGFLANIGKSLVNKLKSLIPSTNPLGAFGGQPSESWAYRPEYKKGKDGAYYAFLSDNSGFLTVNAPASQLFYNDRKFATAKAASKSTVLLASNYHKYYPQKQTDASSKVWYADSNKIGQDSIGVDDGDGHKNNLKDLYNRMVKTIEGSGEKTANQFRRSSERYSEVKDNTGKKYPSYKQIPGQGSTDSKFTDKIGGSGVIENKSWFAKAQGLKQGPAGYSSGFNTYGTYEDSEDRYNSLGVIEGKREEEPKELTQGAYGDNKTQSRDLIFFYFYDLINEIYVPFRATVKSVSDQHTADWEDISYIGRADKLFLYKGFSRDVSFSFTVYANSAKEMMPMWERLNYLVGLTRPSKYTGVADLKKYVSTATTERLLEDRQIAEATGDEGSLQGIDEDLNNRSYSGTNREGKFIYPPMTLFRLGDMFVDQPCIISSVGLNVSDDTNWETLRSDNYEYRPNANNIIEMKGVKVRQLPLQVEVSIQLKILEKAMSLGKNAHYGRSTYDTKGNETGKWML